MNQKIETYNKPTEGCDRILVFGQHSLFKKDDPAPDREWYGAYWCGLSRAFVADGEGYVVSITHWTSMPVAPQ